MRRPGSGGAFTRRTGTIPSATPNSTSDRREVDGGSHTLRNTGGELPPHAASSGAEYRIVVDFDTPNSFLAVQNIGNSGVPGDPHYQDQFEPWLRGEYHVVHLRREDVEAGCESRTVVQPG